MLWIYKAEGDGEIKLAYCPLWEVKGKQKEIVWL